MLPSGAAELGLRFARITLGAYLDHGILVKGIKGIKTYIRKCADAGGGVATFGTDMTVAGADVLASAQICFGIDYDFSTHKCYFHTRAEIIRDDTFDADDIQAKRRPIIGGIRCYCTDAAGVTDTEPRIPINLGPRASSVNVILNVWVSGSLAHFMDFSFIRDCWHCGRALTSFATHPSAVWRWKDRPWVEVRQQPKSTSRPSTSLHFRCGCADESPNWVREDRSSGTAWRLPAAVVDPHAVGRTRPKMLFSFEIWISPDIDFYHWWRAQLSVLNDVYCANNMSSYVLKLSLCMWQGVSKRLLDESDSCLSKGTGEETVRVLTVWTFDVVQQLPGGQSPDSADCARCSRTNTDLVGENVAKWRWAGSVCTGLANEVTSLANW